MKLESHGDVAVLRMNAGKANAVNLEFLDGLERIVAEFLESDARAAVLTGYDRFFSAGLDLVHLIELDRGGMSKLMQRFHDTLFRLFRCPRPVVAAINGHAIAGGCVVALQTDYRILAGDGSLMGLNETQLGVGLPSIVVESLRWQVPHSSWMEVALRGRIFDAKGALAIGLVHEVCDPDLVEPRAMEKARELAGIPGAAYAQVKTSLRRPAIEELAHAGANEADAWLDTWFAPQTRELLARAVAKLKSKSK